MRRPPYRRPLPPLLAAVLAGGAVLAGCSSSTTSTSTTSRATTTTTSAAAGSPATSRTSIAAAVTSAKWASNVSVKMQGSNVVVTSDGLPSTSYWTRPAQYALPNDGVIVPTAATAHAGTDPTVASPITLSIPAVPKWSSTTTATSLGRIGILLSGAALFNAYEGNASTVALASNFSVTGTGGTAVSFVDGCNGHPTPMGQYHYHGVPTCITKVVDGTTGPSHLLGLADDGYPIYGGRDVHGHVVAPASLDACDGIYSATPEFPKGIYHYVLPDVTTARSSLPCFHGVVSSTTSQLAAFTSTCGTTGSPAPRTSSLVAAVRRRT